MAVKMNANALAWDALGGTFWKQGRTSARPSAAELGFYPMDLLLIEEGRRRGTLSRFYDEETCTFDYASAREELEACLVPHGSIERNVLLDWYEGRGKESRFQDEGIQQQLLDAKDA